MSSPLTVTPPFPKVWDNTMLADVSSCEQKANLRFFHHLRPDNPNVNLHAGVAFAKGVEVLRKFTYTPGLDASRAVPEGARALITAYGDFECPPDEPKSLDRVAGAFASYVEQYKPETDHVKPFVANGKPTVEFNFAWPLEINHPETNEPLLYAGRFDMLGVLNGNESALFVVDEKTTKQLGAKWPQQWQLRSQFMGYVWGAKQFGYPVVGAIVRGVSILKTQYGHAEAIVYFPPWMITRWYEQVHYKLARLIQSWKIGKFQHNFDLACSAYGGCPYRILCESEDPAQWVSGHFRVEPWDPLKTHEAIE